MNISLLGSTGSIGRQTLEVCRLLKIKVRAITANRSIVLLEKQAREFMPELVCAFDNATAADLKVRLGDLPVRVAAGMNGLIEAAELDGVDTVVTAVVGTIGLRPTLAAIKKGRRIALANKETLVCAGKIVMDAAKQYGAEIIPVDSEHSAIFQSLDEKRKIKRILLTASGGPFRGMSLEQMRSVTPDMALKNPNWSMGPKVTVDSASMMNKGLEFIEAMHLFSVPPERIKVLVHPQSVVHSMVEYEDNSVIAQLAVPDMRLPIQYALTYPQRCGSLTGELDFSEGLSLTFEEPDLNAFRNLRLAMETAKRPGTACAVMNAANETAVELFLQGKAGFTEIYDLVCSALEIIENIEEPSLEDILESDRRAREYITSRAG